MIGYVTSLGLDMLCWVWISLEMSDRFVRFACLGWIRNACKMFGLDWFGNACIIFGKFRTGWLCLERFGRGLGSVTHWHACVSE